MCAFQHWLSKDWLDAVLARARGTSLSVEQLEVLHKLALKLPRGSQMVMCGGMRTCTTRHFNGSQQWAQNHCPYCVEDRVPGVEHVLWERS
eukprot:15479944-Alexandrium_andersonii.AAC.1